MNYLNYLMKSSRIISNFVPLDPFYRFHFSDGRQFDYRASVDDTLEEIRRFSPADAKGYLALLEQSKKVYDIGFKNLFIARSTVYG